MGLDTESRRTFVIHSPSALSTVTELLFARCVAWANCANLCFTRASALLHQGSGVIVGGSYSRASFGKGIHQTVRSPIDHGQSGRPVRSGVANGCNRKVRRDPLPEAAFHHFGNVAVESGNDGVPNAVRAVTALVPARADVRMERQSVLMFGSVGLSDMAT